MNFQAASPKISLDQSRLPCSAVGNSLALTFGHSLQTASWKIWTRLFIHDTVNMHQF